MGVTWEQALQSAWKQYAGRRVEFGALDCCQFAAAYWFALTGVDHAEKFHYTDRASARAILVEAKGLLGLFRDLLGDESGDPLPGDVVIFDLAPGNECAGIWTGYCVVYVHPIEGVARSSNVNVVAAWRPR